MAISFYKMFGFPTGVGALVVKKSFLEQLRRPWFAGGNVRFVQVPGTLVNRAADLHEQFEVGLLQNLASPPVDPSSHVGWNHKLFEPASYYRWSSIAVDIPSLLASPSFLSVALSHIFPPANSTRYKWKAFREGSFQKAGAADTGGGGSV